MVISSFLAIILLCSLFERFAIANRKEISKLTIFLHVGPHKTGSSHIQYYLTKVRQNLMERGICWPSLSNISTSYSHKALSSLAFDLRSKDQANPQILQEVTKCLTRGLSVIISAEDLCNLDEEEIFILRDALIHLIPSQVKIQFQVIIYYREWISRMYSTYAEETRKSLGKGISFSRHLFIYYDKFYNSAQMNTLLLARRYQKVFGMRNLVIIDYDGVNAARKDIAYVFVCDVLKTLCTESEGLNEKALRENRKPNIPFLHLVYLVQRHIQARGNTVCKFDDSFISETMRYFVTRKLSPPIIRSDVAFLHPLSRAFDIEFRKEFEAIIRYSNQSATWESINQFYAEEIDEQTFYFDHGWIKFLNFEFDRLKRSGRLCTFGGKPLKLKAG